MNKQVINMDKLSCGQSKYVVPFSEPVKRAKIRVPIAIGIVAKTNTKKLC